jgi:hypothetical protein
MAAGKTSITYPNRPQGLRAIAIPSTTDMIHTVRFSSHSLHILPIWLKPQDWDDKSHMPAIGPTYRPVILHLAPARFIHYFANNSISLCVNMFPLSNSGFGSGIWCFERIRESWRSKTMVHVPVPAGIVDPAGLAGLEGRITDATDQARPEQK